MHISQLIRAFTLPMLFIVTTVRVWSALMLEIPYVMEWPSWCLSFQRCPDDMFKSLCEASCGLRKSLLSQLLGATPSEFREEVRLGEPFVARAIETRPDNFSAIMYIFTLTTVVLFVYSVCVVIGRSGYRALNRIVLFSAVAHAVAAPYFFYIQFSSKLAPDDPWAYMTETAASVELICPIVMVCAVATTHDPTREAKRKSKKNVAATIESIKQQQKNNNS